MAGTEYRFDGFDEWEKRLTEAIERQYPAEFEHMVIQVAYELQGRVKLHTPVKTSRLADNWFLGDIVKRGDEYCIEVYNNVDYAEPVEFGHRNRGGGFVKGAHMMELALEDVNRELPAFLQDWLSDFISTHEIL